MRNYRRTSPIPKQVDKRYRTINHQEVRERKNNWDKMNPESKTDYRKTHREMLNASTRKRTQINKMLVYMHYCNGVIQCSCCGELQIEFLTVDHVDGKKKHNHGKDMTGNKLYRWLIKNNYPEGFQVHCWNCNVAKGRFGICPHKRPKSLEIKNIQPNPEFT